MNLFDILLVKKLLEKSGGANSPEIQEILAQLEERVKYDEMEIYVQTSIENLPTLSREEILEILK